MKLYMKQKVFSWRDRFTIKDEEERDIYFVEGELLSWGKKLHVYDAEQNEVAFIREKILSWMPRYTVEIGGREVLMIVKKFSLLRPRYVLEGLPWHIEGEFWEHDYTVYDGSRTVMYLSKKWLTWGDTYELSIDRPEDELPCLCAALAIDAALASAAAAAST